MAEEAPDTYCTDLSLAVNTTYLFLDSSCLCGHLAIQGLQELPKDLLPVRAMASNNPIHSVDWLFENDGNHHEATRYPQRRMRQVHGQLLEFGWGGRRQTRRRAVIEAREVLNQRRYKVRYCKPGPDFARLRSYLSYLRYPLRTRLRQGSFQSMEQLD